MGVGSQQSPVSSQESGIKNLRLELRIRSLGLNCPDHSPISPTTKKLFNQAPAGLYFTPQPGTLLLYALTRLTGNLEDFYLRVQSLESLLKGNQNKI